MAKIANAINIPGSSVLPSLTLGNGSNFLGTNSLDCKGSAAFGTLAGTAAPINSTIAGGFLGIGTAVQSLPGSTAEFLMPPAASECDVLQTSYVGNSATNGCSLLQYTTRGTALASTANQSGDLLGLWGAGGYSGLGFTNTLNATISMVATQAWTTTNNGTAIVFSVTGNNTTTLKEIARIIGTSSSGSGLAITNLGSGLLVQEGLLNARMGVSTLVSGVVSVLNTSITANTRIFLTNTGLAVNVGQLTVSLRIPGVGFTISSQVTTASTTVAWLLIEPSP